MIDSTPTYFQYGDGISELCVLAIVLPFHYVDFLMKSRADGDSEKDLDEASQTL